MSAKRHNGISLDDDDQWVLRYVYYEGTDAAKIMQRTGNNTNEQLQSLYGRLTGAFNASNIVDAANKAKEAGII
jgi:hypothetical protein